MFVYLLNGLDVIIFFGKKDFRDYSQQITSHIFKRRKQPSGDVLVFKKIFFSIRVFFHGHWRLIGQQWKGGDHFLFHSTTSTRSRTFRHLFATLHVRWLSHIFNRNTCIYQTVTRSDFLTLSNYHLIDWWCEVCFNLFTWWFDTRFLLHQSWHGKPVDSDSHRLSLLYYKRTD